MINSLARAISNVFNPLVIILPVPYLLVYKTTHNVFFALKWSFVSYVFIAFIAVFVASGVFLGYFTDFDVSKRKQRTALYIFALIITFLYLLTLFLLKGPPVLFIAVGGLILGLIVLAEINQKIKASIHVATISAIITSGAILYGGIFLLALLLIPLIAWSRVKTKRHTFKEAVAGGIFGVVFTIMIYMAMELKF
jgi:hypothetical protein